METTDICFPPNILALLEATAIANGYKPEEVVRAAIEDFLQKANQRTDE
ncbi:MAG: hypothetical protein K8R38_06150 [Verrucomicrobia bacterium]|jgi:hypothetical protein|nr:hypothetical protein [Verrucomicrobiota bacterium]